MVWEELTHHNAYLPQKVDKLSHPEIFLPWTNVTSTGFLMAEVLKFHRRSQKKSAKKTEDQRHESENDESEGEEEDLDMIKEDIAKEITRKLGLFRTSVSLKWNLTGISLLVLQLLKSQEL